MAGLATQEAQVIAVEGKESDGFPARLAAWDRSAFGVAMRQIEVLILKGDRERARRVFDGVLRRECRSPHVLSDSVYDVLPLRVAETLAKAGYETLEAAARASDGQLRSIRNFGTSCIGLVRETAQCVAAGEPLPRYGTEGLEPEFDLDSVGLDFGFRCGGSAVHETGQNGATSTGALAKALEVLSGAGPEAVAAIDKEIAGLNDRIAQLKKMRKLIAPASSGRSTPGATKLLNYERLIDKMRTELQSGPLRAKELAKRCGFGNYAFIGRIAAAHEDFRSEGGLISLVQTAS